MLIDAHMHIGVWEHADFLGRRCDVADAIQVMKEAGLSGAVIVPTDRCDNAGLLEDIRVNASRARLWFFPWVRPVHAGGLEQLEWVRGHAKDVTGIKIHPSLSRARVCDDPFRPALEMAEELGLVVLVHCGRWQEMASYRFALEAAARHPRARFLLAHGGGDTPPLATAAAELVHERALDNVWFEFSGVREYWVIERNVRLLGAERYLMGSDYNLAHPNMYIGAVAGMDLPERDKARILGLNALELLGDSVTVSA